MGGKKSGDPTQPHLFFTIKTWKNLLSLLSCPILLHQFLNTSFTGLVIISNILTTLFTLFSFSALSKPHSRLYGLCCMIFSLLVPLAIIFLTEEFFFFFFGSVLVSSILLLFLTGNHPYCLSSLLIQLLIINFPLKGLLWRNVCELPSETLIMKILEALTIQLLESIILICISKYTLKYIYNRAQNHQSVIEFVKLAHKKYIDSFSFEIKDALNGLQVSVHAISLREISSSDREMLKIARISAENVHRLYSNMTQLFELDSENLGTVLNYTYSLSFLETAWEVALSIIERKRQEGALKILNEIPEHIKLDIHRTKHLIINLVEFLLHNDSNKRVDVHVEWLEQDLSLLSREFKPNSKDLLGKNLSEYIVYSKEIFEGNSNQIFPSKTQEKGGFLKITVIGTGFSLKENHIKSIFDKICIISQDLPKTTSELGLCAVKNICKTVKGLIMLKSHELSMSFNIYIPSWHEVKDDVIG